MSIWDRSFSRKIAPRERKKIFRPWGWLYVTQNWNNEESVMVRSKNKTPLGNINISCRLHCCCSRQTARHLFNWLRALPREIKINISWLASFVCLLPAISKSTSCTKTSYNQSSNQAAIKVVSSNQPSKQHNWTDHIHSCQGLWLSSSPEESTSPVPSTIRRGVGSDIFWYKHGK